MYMATTPTFVLNSRSSIYILSTSYIPLWKVSMLDIRYKKYIRVSHKNPPFNSCNNEKVIWGMFKVSLKKALRKNQLFLSYSLQYLSF